MAARWDSDELIAGELIASGSVDSAASSALVLAKSSAAIWATFSPGAPSAPGHLSVREVSGGVLCASFFNFVSSL
jgi:hypothetical protein